MTTIMLSPQSEKSYLSDDERWRAVAQRDKSADAAFVYSVETTGVYCRPSCGARLARRENVRFHLTPAGAEAAGFRACKRCKPRRINSESEHAEAIAKACRMIDEAEESPGLDALAGAAAMSLSHFHRIFKSMTGLTPKAYATAHRAQRMREELTRDGSVTSAIYKAGYNSNGRFYATSSKVLGMKPADYRGGGKGATIRFAVDNCWLGSILVAATPRGICAIKFGDDPEALVKDLKNQFPKAELIGGDEEFEQWVAKVVAFVERPATGLNLPLDVQGTAFQQRVWQKLCEIPCGSTRSYAEIAAELGNPKATRAVGHACGANPVAVAIPCHRVLRTDGSLSGYRWGHERKAKLLEAERKKD